MDRFLRFAVVVALGTAACRTADTPKPSPEELRDAVASPIFPAIAGRSGPPNTGYFARPAATRPSGLAPRIDESAADLTRATLDTLNLRSDLHLLLERVRTARPEADSALPEDIERFPRHLAQLVRDQRAILDDLRLLAPTTGKDAALLKPARLLTNAAHQLNDESSRLLLEARAAYFELTRAGFTVDALDLDRNSREVGERAQDLKTEADRLLAAVRG